MRPAAGLRAIKDALRVNDLMRRPDRVAAAAPYAKAAIDMALWDACGKATAMARLRDRVAAALVGG